MTVSFASASSTASESGNVVNIPLQLDGASSKEVFVTYEVSGTADFPLDVTPMTNTTFIIPPGSSAFNIEFIVLEDNVIELESESFIIELISISDGGRLGTNTIHEMTIAPDDIATVSFRTPESSTYQWAEDPLEVEVVLSKPMDEDISVSFTTDGILDDVSGEPMFYASSSIFGSSRTLEFLAGETSKSIFVEYNFFSLFSALTESLTFEIELSQIRPLTSEAKLHPNEDLLSHTVNVGPRPLDQDPNIRFDIELSWTSSNSDVDLDLILTDLDGNWLSSSEDVDVDATEDISMYTVDFDDGSYGVYVRFYSGSSETIDIQLTLTPENGSTYDGSTSPVVFDMSLSREDLGDGKFALILDKSGVNFTKNPDYETLF